MSALEDAAAFIAENPPAALLLWPDKDAAPDMLWVAEIEHAPGVFATGRGATQEEALQRFLALVRQAAESA